MSDVYDDESWIYDYKYDCDSPDWDEKPSYEEWLQETGCEDTPETEGWYNCSSEEECAKYWVEHPDWAKNF